MQKINKKSGTEIWLRSIRISDFLNHVFWNDIQVTVVKGTEMNMCVRPQ